MAKRNSTPSPPHQAPNQPSSQQPNEAPGAAAGQQNGAPERAEHTLPDRGEPTDPLRPKIIEFQSLAHCGNEIWISHQGKLYRLQSTRQGKLVLTK